MRRIALPLLAAILATPPVASGAARQPDLVPVAPNATTPVLVRERYFDPVSDRCSLEEGAIPQPGWLVLLEFPTQTANLGRGDLKIGNPAARPDWYVFAPCHQHYHFEQYGDYQLLNPAGSEVAFGHKQGFCIIDTELWDSRLAKSTRPRYTDCDINQGLSVGWADTYSIGTPGQWIVIGRLVDGVGWDVLPAGEYTLRVAVNYAGVLPESSYSNNVISRSVTVPANWGN